MKKINLLALVAAGMMLQLSGCKRSSGNTARKTGSSAEFSYLMQSRFIDWLQEDKWYPYLLKNTNTTIDLVAGPAEDNDYYSAVDQKIISGTFPDTGIVSVSQAKVYGSQGAFVDLKPYIEKYGAHIQSYIDAHPDYKKIITADNGAVYGLVAEAPRIGDFLFYRADMFKKAGVTKQPATIEEFTDALRKLKAFYGKKNPNYYPLTGREGYIRFQSEFNAAAGFENGTSHGIYGNGKTGTDIYLPGYRNMVAWYAALYKEGLIDPEWVAGATNEESWQMKMLTGQGSVSYDYYTRPSWFMDNGGPSNDPDYQIAVLPYLKDSTGNPSVHTTEIQYNILRAMVVNVKSKDKAEAVIRFLDYLFSDEGQTLVQWGVEGQSYKIADGKKQFIVDYSKEEATPKGQARWSFLSDRLTFVKPLNDADFFTWNTDLVRDAALELFTDTYLRSAVMITYTAEQSKDLSNLTASVQDAVTAGVTQFVTGKRPVSEWNSFVKEMDDKGYRKIVAIQQAAYDAVYKK